MQMEQRDKAPCKSGCATANRGAPIQFKNQYLTMST